MIRPRIEIDLGKIAHNAKILKELYGSKGIEDKFKLKLEFVSGGNSANYDWFMSTKDVGRINNLRLGESIFSGQAAIISLSMPNNQKSK